MRRRLDHLPEEVESSPGFVVKDGVVELLDRLIDAGVILLGLTTGNVEEAAHIKLVPRQPQPLLLLRRLRLGLSRPHRADEEGARARLARLRPQPRPRPLLLLRRHSARRRGRPRRRHPGRRRRHRRVHGRGAARGGRRRRGGEDLPLLADRSGQLSRYGLRPASKEGRPGGRYARRVAKRIVPSHFNKDGKPKRGYVKEEVARAEAARFGKSVLPLRLLRPLSPREQVAE